MGNLTAFANQDHLPHCNPLHRTWKNILWKISCNVKYTKDGENKLYSNYQEEDNLNCSFQNETFWMKPKSDHFLSVLLFHLCSHWINPLKYLLRCYPMYLWTVCNSFKVLLTCFSKYYYCCCCFLLLLLIVFFVIFITLIFYMLLCMVKLCLQRRSPNNAKKMNVYCCHHSSGQWLSAEVSVRDMGSTTCCHRLC